MTLILAILLGILILAIPVVLIVIRIINKLWH